MPRLDARRPPDLDAIRSLLLLGLLQSAVTPLPADPPLDFYFSDDAVLNDGIGAATARWTEQCIQGGEFASIAAAYAPDASTPAAARRAQAEKFDRSEFIRLATDAWTGAQRALPQGAARVCVDLAAPMDLFTRDVMGGITGVTAGSGRIILRIHPDGEWRQALGYALAHELHHSYWERFHFDPAAPFTLADYLGLEGRADYFAGTLYARRPPWTAALDPAADAAAWKELAEHLDSTDWPTLQAAMFGSPGAGIPMWAGYSIGYRLVSERMRRAPALDLAAMTAAPASEFMPPRVSK